MQFFSRFPKIDYAFQDTPEENKRVVNILSAFFVSKIALNSSAFLLYSMNDGETVESISETLYKSPLYYWVLLLNNNIVNPWMDWTQTSDAIRRFTEKKYKTGITQKLADGTERTIPFTTGLSGIHHFLNDTTNSVCDDVDDAAYRDLWGTTPTLIPDNILPITNIEYELETNANNRTINVVDVGNLQKFVENFNMMLGNFTISQVK